MLPSDIGVFDVFVRGDGGNVEHYWHTADGLYGPELLGGRFDSDPVARDFPEGRLHLLGRSGQRIVDWSWDGPAHAGPLGPPAEDVLPGFCLTDPEVLVAGDVYVFALGVEGEIRRWLHRPGAWWTAPRRLTSDLAASRPVAICRTAGVIDVFAAASGGGLRQWSKEEGTSWTSTPRGGGHLVGRPTVDSSAPRRLDVFAVGSDGVPLHWGWNGARWFDAEKRLEMPPPGAPQPVVSEVHLVAFGGERLVLIAREADGSVVRWTLEPPTPGTPAAWAGPSTLESGALPPAAWSLGEDDFETLHRRPDGAFHYYHFTVDPGGGMGEAVPLVLDDAVMDPAEPEPAPQTMTPLPLDPDLLLVRPEDLVLLGVRWSGFTVRTPPGAPAELVPGAGAELTVLLPPQHVAEEVVPAVGAVVPGLPPGATGGFPTWRAALSGASRIVVGFPSGDPPVPLTAEGVLDAVRRGRLLPGTGTQDRKTALEIPYGLVLSPHPPAEGEVRCAHPAAAVRSPTESVGLWQTTVSAAGTAAGAPAGLTLRPLSATSNDPFPVPLTGASRARILLEPPTARIDRLALSSLGGSLTAAGDWGTFRWEHDATLGRDRKVRTVTKGVLYPFGQRAVYTESTERVFASTAQGAIAHLRKSTTLTITDPVRQEPADPGLQAAFPFEEVEIERTFFEGVTPLNEEFKEFPVPELEALLGARSGLLTGARSVYERLYVDGGRPSGSPPIEDLADGQTPDASAARAYLNLQEELAEVDEKIDALPHHGLVSLRVLFVPGAGGTAIDFPVRLRGRLGDLHVSMPLVFLEDIDKPQGLFDPPFVSLTDSEVADWLRATHQGVGGAVVDTRGARIDLVRSAAPVTQDVCEVARLHVVGTRHEGGYRARLGVEPAAEEGRRPPEGRWGFDATLPAVRALLGPEKSTVRLALSGALLRSEPELKVPFVLPVGVEDLAVKFTENSARSGGLVAPDLVADGISRLDGPVNVAGLLDRNAAGKLDPAKILGDTATLLGYRLSDLIDADVLKAPPAVLTEPQEGRPPRITLQWRRVKLATGAGSFVTGHGGESELDLDVVMAAEGQKVTCTVTNVALALPDRADKLLEVSFDKIEFIQEGGQPPTLRIDGIHAEFFGPLNLLKELQEQVDLGGSAPQIESSTTGVSATYALPVPDVTAGVFRMTGLAFHAGIDVPFDTRPVTVSLGFASREKPFNLSVLMFGGGGYVDVVIDRTGLRRLEAALEFGASVAVDFLVASGEVHAMGGVHLRLADGTFVLGGYLRLGGHVSVLGLVTVSVELTITLEYHSDTNEMTGRATLVLEIDLTLFSESVEIDTGTWVLAGGGRDRGPQPLPAAAPGASAQEWDDYRGAFAEGQE
ncbi:hypothetical protein ACFWIA_14630 [Streptomyces sp. NPDC127068]|uniref:hypothetical protein n=1 Tax=Streptomyces sp. NPDC127068 TaxID=3347127 RepID=UPI003646154C